MIDEAVKKITEKFDSIIESFNQELKNVRTGRATPSVLDDIMVDYYGVATPINQTAAISASDAKTIVITPWDKDQLISIEKAIKAKESQPMDIFKAPQELEQTHKMRIF